MAKGKKTVHLLKASDVAGREEMGAHPWNPKSEVRGTRMAPLTGLKRLGVSWVRIPPGKESFVYHAHLREEEWIYILSGRGIAEIDGAEYEVGPGDFMGFPTPSVAHHLRNAGGEDLVYLMGGENLDFEVADFPKLGKRMIRSAKGVEVFDADEAKSLSDVAAELHAPASRKPRAGGSRQHDR